MEENKFLTLLSKHGSKILLGVLLVAAVAVWSQKIWNSKNRDQKQDFFIANQIFERFHSGEHLSSESIEAAEKILERHPELHPKYDVVLALTLFSQQKVAEALPYAHSLVDHAPAPALYQEFAQTTLLISEGKYAEALTATQQLDQKLNSEKKMPILAGMNTLRLFFLADQLGDKTLKKNAWEKLEKQPSFASLNGLFHEGNVSLSDFTKTRLS